MALEVKHEKNQTVHDAVGQYTARDRSKKIFQHPFLYLAADTSDVMAATDPKIIENFRWHDLRHTWASWHVQAGTPLHVLQELGGWESVEMVRRYAHLSTDHLAEYVERMSGTLKVGSAEAKSGKVVTI